MKRYSMKIFGFIIFILIILVVYKYILSTGLLSLESIQAARNTFVFMVKQYYWGSVIAYISFYVFATILSIPGAVVLSLLGGFLFGLWGTVYVTTGATIGAAGSFFLVRYTIGSLVQRKYAMSLRAFNENLDRFGVFFLFGVRLIPIIPFFLINILAGMTTISTKTFIITTFIGIMPVSFLYVLAGRNLASIESVRDIVSWRVLSPLLLIGSLIIITGLYQLFKKEKKI